jgi:uncharacterized protein DUF4157
VALQRLGVGPAPARWPSIVRQALGVPGRTIEPPTREALESGFGHDFARVRVHTDATAAASARAVRAVAYTVGDDIVFDSGTYAPDSSSGRRLLAHELTHVVQQRNAGSASGQRAKRADALTMGRPGDHAEGEAERVAADVTAGRPVRVTERPRVTLQGSWWGAGVGGTLGAIGGAVVGGLLLGPLGAIAGGLLGLIAGAALGDVASSKARKLNDQERRAAKKVFADSLDLDQITISEAPVMSIGGYARTLPGAIYFPPGKLNTSTTWGMKWLVHELTHAWQYMHGITVIETLVHAIIGHYDYGGEPGLIAARKEGKRFIDFNTEQQGDILGDYYERLVTKQSTIAWSPFVAEVQGTRGILPEYMMPAWP